MRDRGRPVPERGLVYGGARVCVGSAVCGCGVSGGVVACLERWAPGLWMTMAASAAECVGGGAEHATGFGVEAAVVFDHAVDAFDGVASGVVGCPLRGAVGVALVVVDLVDAEG